MELRVAEGAGLLLSTLSLFMVLNSTVWNCFSSGKDRLNDRMKYENDSKSVAFWLTFVFCKPRRSSGNF